MCNQHQEPELQLSLPGVDDTLRLGQELARGILRLRQYPCIILLQGELGAGKTTLVRGLTQALPGGQQAQVSSPSFNIMNVYPTDPEVLHLDLYRLSGPEAAESLWENLSQDYQGILLVEWSENLPIQEYPEQYYLLHLHRQGPGRTAQLLAIGCRLEPLIDKVQHSGLNIQEKGE